MPRVPTYDSPQTTINPISAPQVNAPNAPDIVGRDQQVTGELLSKAGETLLKVSERNFALNSQAILDMEGANAGMWDLDYFRSNNNRAGEKAMGITDSYVSEFKSYVDQRRQSVPKHLRNQFDSQMAIRVEAGARKWAKYEAEQAEAVRVAAFDNNTLVISKQAENAGFTVIDGQSKPKIFDFFPGTEGYGDISGDAPVSDIVDSEEYETYLVNLRDHLMNATERGVPKAVVEAGFAKVLEDLTIRRVNQVLASDPSKAVRYIEKYGDRILDTEKRAGLMAKAKGVERSAALENEIESLYYNNSDPTYDQIGEKTDKGYLSPEQIRGMIEYRLQGEEQKTALDIFDKLVTNYTKERKATNDAYVNQAWSKVLENNSFDGMSQSDLFDLRNSFPEEYKKMSEYVKKMQKDGVVKTDPATWYDLYNMATSRNPADQQTFMNLNLMTFANSVGLTELKSLAEMQNKLRNPETKTEKDHSYFSIGDLIKRAADKWGIDDDDKADFSYAVLRYLEGIDPKGKLSDADREKVINKLAIEGQVIDGGFGGFLNKDMNYYEYLFSKQFDPKRNPFFADIPKATRLAISKDLQARDIPVTEDNIISVFVEMRPINVR